MLALHTSLFVSVFLRLLISVFLFSRVVRFGFQVLFALLIFPLSFELSFDHWLLHNLTCSSKEIKQSCCGTFTNSSDRWALNEKETVFIKAIWRTTDTLPYLNFLRSDLSRCRPVVCISKIPHLKKHLNVKPVWQQLTHKPAVNHNSRLASRGHTHSASQQRR